MRIEDEALLDEFRTAGPCEFCGKWCRHREPHHVHTRGAGRLDIRINLLALGSQRHFECPCHGDIHGNGRIRRADLLAIVAAREGLLQDDITAEIYRLRRAPKMKVGDEVRLYTPSNPRLHNAIATVSELAPWGAHVKTDAAATGQFRAAWTEMRAVEAQERDAGYTGDSCDACGGMRMRRAGACLVCDDCGTSGGCG